MKKFYIIHAAFMPNDKLDPTIVFHFFNETSSINEADFMLFGCGITPKFHLDNRVIETLFNHSKETFIGKSQKNGPGFKFRLSTELR